MPRYRYVVLPRWPNLPPLPPQRCVRSGYRGEGEERGTKISCAAFAMQITRIHIYATGVDIPLTCIRTNRPILFFFPITTSLSPLPSFPIFSRRVTKRSSNEKRDSKSFLFPPRSNFLPHSSLLRGVFLSEGGTCKVDVSRNKIKLKIASIVAVSFVILRHFRARGETTLQRRWCGNRSPLARKRMRPKKNRYRLYRPSFVGNIVRASVCRGWEKE